MNGLDSNENKATCKVCILQSKDTGAFRVVYTLNLPQLLRQPDTVGSRIMYCRRFDDLLDGLGHKLFLEQLSPLSIKRFLAIKNKINNSYY